MACQKIGHFCAFIKINGYIVFEMSKNTISCKKIVKISCVFKKKPYNKYDRDFSMIDMEVVLC